MLLLEATVPDVSEVLMVEIVVDPRLMEEVVKEASGAGDRLQ